MLGINRKINQLLWSWEGAAHGPGAAHGILIMTPMESLQMSSGDQRCSQTSLNRRKNKQSWNTKLEGTSRSTWCNLSCQKYDLGKPAQHPAQLNLKVSSTGGCITSLGK